MRSCQGSSITLCGSSEERVIRRVLEGSKVLRIVSGQDHEHVSKEVTLWRLCIVLTVTYGEDTWELIEAENLK